MQTRVLRLLVGLCVAALGACSAPSSPAITSLPGMNSGGSGNASGGSTTVAGTSGMAAGSGGMSTTAGAGGSSGAGTAGSGAQAGAAGTASTTMSAGCGKPLPALVTPSATTWSEMADQDARAGKPPPMMVPCEVDPAGKAAPPCVNGMKPRGFFVMVKPGFDNTKPSKVIYEAAGCDDSSDAHGGTSGYKYQDFDSGSSEQVIQVGMDYSRNDNCYDNANPKSNDFQFFPMLHKYIEDNFCVDPTHQYFSGYSTGAWVAQQFTCAFPDVLRGIVASTGNEPPQQPTCAPPGHPVAGMFLHDLQDTYNTYAGMKPGCARLLSHNGCTTTTCEPTDTTLSDPYIYPTNLGSPQGMACVSFKGCPATAPVVWCTTSLGGGNNSHYIGADKWVTGLFWDFLNKY